MPSSNNAYISRAQELVLHTPFEPRQRLRNEVPIDFISAF